MNKTSYIYARTGLAMCGLSIVLGAFAAHLLATVIEPERIQTFDTGVRYMFFHSLVIVMLSLNARKLHLPIFERVMIFFITGVLIFSGSLFLLATRSIWGGDDFIWIGAITPVGGASFIGGWVYLFAKGIKLEEKTSKQMTFLKNKKNKSRHHKHSPSGETPPVDLQSNTADRT